MKGNIYRTYTCSELREKHVGEEIKLAGWVDTIRDLGGVLFIDLRDQYGITQVVVSGDEAKVDFAEANGKQFIVMYGQTEAAPRMSYLPHDKAVEKNASIGIAIPGGKFSIIDADGNESEPIQGCRVVEAVLSGKSNPAQEHGSALTYARRYSLQMAYGLATEDDDAESLTRKPEPVKPKGKAKPISDMQFVSVTDAIDAMGKTQLAICEHYGIGSISDMNTDQYSDLMKIYNAWRAKQNA